MSKVFSLAQPCTAGAAIEIFRGRFTVLSHGLSLQPSDDGL
jgi:hypothetical protein